MNAESHLTSLESGFVCIIPQIHSLAYYMIVTICIMLICFFPFLKMKDQSKEGPFSNADASVGPCLIFLKLSCWVTNFGRGQSKDNCFIYIFFVI